MTDKTDKIMSILSDLSPDEQEELLESLVVKSRDKKHRQPKHRTVASEDREEYVAKTKQERRRRGNRRNKKNTHEKLYDDDNVASSGGRHRRPTSERAGNRNANNSNDNRQSRKRNKKRNAGKILPVQTGPRQNEFVSSDIAKSYTNDSKIDAKLSGGNEPTPRRNKTTYVEAECTVCGEIDDVLPSLTYVDTDAKKRLYRCDRCSPRG